MTNNTSNVSYEILGINPSALAGLPQSEIVDMIRLVQDGVQGDKMTEDEIQAAAEQIYKDAN
ncbi:MAG: hypothetical protein WC374_13435 [Phycisphaerae bacterium]|jgi:hypothetical protein